jgi:hypothetical protein
LCASLKEKLKVLDTKAKEVYGNDRKACMVMKDRDKLFLEAQIELKNNVAKVAIEEEKTCSLKAKIDKLLHDRLDFLTDNYIEDELKLIDNQIKDSMDQTICEGEKVEDLQGDNKMLKMNSNTQPKNW